MKEYHMIPGVRIHFSSHEKFTSTFDEDVRAVPGFKREELTRGWRKLHDLY